VSLLLPLLYLAGHTLALAFSSHPQAASFGFLTVAPLMAGAACLWRSRRDEVAPAWIALAVALLLWAGGMAVNMVQTVWMHNADVTAGVSILLYVLYGVPLIFALSSPARERWQVRAIDLVLALVLSALFFVHTFSFSTTRTTSAAGLDQLLLMLDIENGLIAVFSLIRYLASQSPARRQFYRTQTLFAWVYLAVATYINHGEPADTDFGGFSDLLIDLPFLLLTGLCLRPRRTAPPTWVSPALSLLVQACCPLLLPMSLLVMSALLSSTHLSLAIAGFAIATLGYGVRSVLIQLRTQVERDQLDALARVDTLTGLANRRQFDDVLQREWQRARRTGEPLSLLMIDVDHFKRLNDAFGHQTGDVRLRAVAGALAAGSPRALDLVARYGGEEFAVILPATDAPAALALAEHMRAAVLDLQLPAAAPQPWVTVSIGVGTAAPARQDSPEALLAQTDAALYEAKSAGRNCVIARPLASD